jgi:hypothetical protein
MSSAGNRDNNSLRFLNSKKTEDRQVKQRQPVGTNSQRCFPLTDAERPTEDWHREVTQGPYPPPTMAQWKNIRAGTEAIAGSVGTACHSA